MLKLEDDEVQIWYAYTARCSTPDLLASYYELLSPDERSRHARFAFDELKVEFLLTRALCRIMLSHYTDVDPAAWTFGANGFGRPHLAGPVRGLSFNLSNTRRLVAMAVTRNLEEVGVDVAELDRHPAPFDIAERFFSASECAGLKALEGAAKSRRFFDLWALKEAYVKARGQGLSISLDAFSIELGAGEIRIGFDAGTHEDGAAWQFGLRHLQDRHNLAVCVRRPPGRAARLSWHEVVPRVAAVRPRG